MKFGLTWVGIGLLFFSVSSARADRASVLGDKESRRYTTVAVEWFGNDARFHSAIDVEGRAEQSWRHAVNQCGGVSNRCYALKSWGKYGCLVIYKGWSRAGRVWIGHSLALLHPTMGNGAMKFMIEDSARMARRICDFHAHYDEKGRIYDPEMPYTQGYCARAKVVCSEELQQGEFESVSRR